MNKLSPYLNFDGNCAEAFAFYHRIFGGEPPMTLTYENSPIAGNFPAEWGSKVLHTRIAFDGNVLMGSDAPPGKFEKAQGITLTLNPETPEEAERLFTALSENGEVTMPLAETFWAQSFGELVDQFGIPWIVNCEKKR